MKTCFLSLRFFGIWHDMAAEFLRQKWHKMAGTSGCSSTQNIQIMLFQSVLMSVKQSETHLGPSDGDSGDGLWHCFTMVLPTWIKFWSIPICFNPQPPPFPAATATGRLARWRPWRRASVGAPRQRAPVGQRAARYASQGKCVWGVLWMEEILHHLVDGRGWMTRKKRFGEKTTHREEHFKSLTFGEDNLEYHTNEVYNMLYLACWA